MAFTLFVPRETAPAEKRVALVPSVAGRLAELGAEVLIQAGAGAGAGIPDTAYSRVTVVNDAREAAAKADLLLRVQCPETAEIESYREGAMIIGFLSPHRFPERIAAMRTRRLTAFAVELIPRISRAQSMDALSSQAACAGYKAALLAAARLERFLPMLTTAAGTIRPARILVVGAGVAGLQAIATARRLGAVVEAYDVRAAAREQVASLGARFIDTGVAADAAGGYARELTDEEKRKQMEVLASHVAQADIVICTAQVPGRRAPVILTADMVAGMKAGTIVFDLAADSGGNCELTRPDEEVRHGGTRIMGPLNVPSLLAEHASEMYAKNLQNFLAPVIHDGSLAVDWDDEVYAKSVVTRAGNILHEPTRQLVEAE